MARGSLRGAVRFCGPTYGYSHDDGRSWRRHPTRMQVFGLHHNVFAGFHRAIGSTTNLQCDETCVVLLGECGP